MSFDTASPYAASYVIFRRGKKILFVLRSNTGWMDGHWGLPAGKVEKDETFRAGAMREAREEVGIKLKPENLKFLHLAHRHAESDWVDVFFEAKKWEGEPTNAEPNVHGEIAWMDPDDLPKDVIPAIRFYLEQIQAGNLYSEFGWDTSKEVS